MNVRFDWHFVRSTCYGQQGSDVNEVMNRVEGNIEAFLKSHTVQS